MILWCQRATSQVLVQQFMLPSFRQTPMNSTMWGLEPAYSCTRTSTVELHVARLVQYRYSTPVNARIVTGLHLRPSQLIAPPWANCKIQQAFVVHFVGSVIVTWQSVAARVCTLQISHQSSITSTAPSKHREANQDPSWTERFWWICTRCWHKLVSTRIFLLKWCPGMKFCWLQNGPAYL